MLQTNALNKGYTKKDVLKDVTLSLSEGTIYGLIGSNGSGKTTLLKCLSGIFRPDSGSVTMDDAEVYDNPEAKRKIAYVDDTPGFNQLYSVRKQGEYYGAFYEDFSMEAFEKLAGQFELKQKANANNISLGQKKKLALAQALARTPQVLLLDEPENGMDNESRRIFRNCLRDAADNGSTVLLSSHDLGNIEDMCDEVIFLKDGEVILQSTIDDMFAKISKWTVKSAKKDFADTVVLEESGDLLTLGCMGLQAESGEKLQQAGAELISMEKVTLADAYMIYKEVANREE